MIHAFFGFLLCIDHDRAVIVNGVHTLGDGELTGTRGGRVLRAARKLKNQEKTV